MDSSDKAIKIRQLASTISELSCQLRNLSGRYRGNIDVKPDGSMVTDLDRDFEQTLKEQILTLFPEATLLCEEAQSEGASALTVSEWGPLQGMIIALDPLDGTENFVQGLPFYGISVGSLEWNGTEHTPAWGLIALPSIGQLLMGWGSGMYVLDLFTGRETEILPISDGGAWLVPRWFYGQWQGSSQLLRTTGSSAFDLFQLLTGAAVCTFSQAYLWDLLGGLGIGMQQHLSLFSLRTGSELTPITGQLNFSTSSTHRFRLRERVLICRHPAAGAILNSMSSSWRQNA